MALFESKKTGPMKEDILRAIINLEAVGGENWLAIKKWIFDEYNYHSRIASLNYKLSDNELHAYQGKTHILNDLNYYMENTREEIEAGKKRAALPNVAPRVVI